MVTLTKNTQENTFAFKGLSTDTKPVETFQGLEIPNGSSFFAIDTQSVVFYDAENKEWPEPSI